MKSTIATISVTVIAVVLVLFVGYFVTSSYLSVVAAINQTNANLSQTDSVLQKALTPVAPAAK